MRTLVVSDLHLGSQSKRDLLRDPAVRAPLLSAAAECDRLVLLGDVLELRHGPERDALAVARAPLTALGGALREGAEVVIAPGNHDHQLLSPWLRRRECGARAAPLGDETAVEVAPGDALATLAAWFADARVRVAYPGVWLRPDVYATHGHYLDPHLTIPTIERLAAGVMARVLQTPAGGPRSAEDYEALLAPIYAWIDAVAQRLDPALGGRMHGGSARGWSALTGPSRGSLRRRAMVAGFPLLVAAANRAGIGPLRPGLSGPELRRAGLRGISEVVTRLGVTRRAAHVIFGHTHRAGPLVQDDAAEWAVPGHGDVRLLNTGCWVDEPAFTRAAPALSPYRVGFCAWVTDDGPPELVNLLDR